MGVGADDCCHFNRHYMEADWKPELVRNKLSSSDIPVIVEMCTKPIKCLVER